MGERGITLYADDGRILGIESGWFQDGFTEIIDLIVISWLYKNEYKIKSIFCVPDYLWGCQT